MSEFRNEIAEHTFRNKYAMEVGESWHERSRAIVEAVCGTNFGEYSAPILGREERDYLVKVISEFKFMPGGRYIYYAGRPAKYWNNCFLLRAEEDTREEWANVAHRSTSCLMTGGGIGCDYSLVRPAGRVLRRTGGISSGPIPLMHIVNEIGRNVMQGGSRRSAIYASLDWDHDDARAFLTAKNWEPEVRAMKEKDFNFPAPLDMTNISLNYKDSFLEQVAEGKLPDVFLANVRQAMKTGEPGFSFNFGEKQNETLRNAPLGPDTYVETAEEGYVRIGDIVDTPIKVWTGKQFAKTVFKRTGESVPVVRVRMSGDREIVADPSHEFFLAGGGKVPASELEPGMSLLVSLCDEDGIEDKVTASLQSDYYTLGYVYGDGSFHKRYPRAEVTLCTDESKQCWKGFDWRLVSSRTEKDSRGYMRVYFKNNKLFANRHKEVFPDTLHSVGTSQKAAFIGGIFDADGSYDQERGRVRLASKHREFLHGVRRMLESLGILSGVSTAGVSTYGKEQGYLLTVASEHVTRFSELIPTIRLKVQPYEAYRKYQIKVIAVEDAGVSDVFCCDVGVEEHAFQAEGVIVSNCTEVTSEDDSDVCNLGSINLGAIESIEELVDVVTVASKFLVCGTVRADLPYRKVAEVREKNRRLGLGIMGIHEWLLKRGKGYEVDNELKEWLAVYASQSKRAANEHCDRLYLSRPVAYRAVAPTGTIGMLAATTTGIEPLYSVAYKRRYLVDGTRWKYEYVVDSTAQHLIDTYGVNPDDIETALSLSQNPERRIKFQADVQDYVDMAISSTINLPAWGSKHNNDDLVGSFADTLARYAHRLRGFTCYPDGARGGQPLTVIPYEDAVKRTGTVYEEHDVCALTGHGGTCGV